MGELKRLEDKFNVLIDKYLSVVNSEIKKYEKNKAILIENYVFNLSHKIMDEIKNNYHFNIDMSIISDGTIVDINKVIINYNNKYESQIINYTNIEDLFMDDSLSIHDRCLNILNYLSNAKDSYMMENDFINNLNQTFAKRITTRIMNYKPDIDKNESIKLLNTIYSYLKNDTYGFLSELNDLYIKTNSNILTISHKLSEAMAQMELLNPYLEEENEDINNHSSRVEKFRNLDDDINE